MSAVLGPDSEYVPTGIAEKIANLSSRRLWYYEAIGQIRSIRLWKGGPRLFSRRELEAFVEKRREEQTARAAVATKGRPLKLPEESDDV